MRCLSKREQTRAGTMMLMMIAHSRLLGALGKCSKMGSCGNLMKWGLQWTNQSMKLCIYTQMWKCGNGKGKKKRKLYKNEPLCRMSHSICNSSATHCSSNSPDRNSLKDAKKRPLKAKNKRQKERKLKKNDIFWARENQSHLHTLSEPTTRFAGRDREFMLLRKKLHLLSKKNKNHNNNNYNYSRILL